MSRSFTDDMKTDSGYFDSGKRIVMLAHTAGIKSSKQLAHLLGVSRNTVQNWHKGGVVAGQEHVEDFCGLINISMADFYSREFPVNNKEIEKSVNIKKFSMIVFRMENADKLYVRYKEGAKMFSISERQFNKIAHEAGAVAKLEKTALVSIRKMQEYLEDRML